MAPTELSLEGARCAVHPDAAATGTCARCGNFVCGRDTNGGASDACESCRRRQAPPFPFSRDAFTIGGLWEHSLAIAQRDWVMLALASLILFGVQGAVSTGGQMAIGVITAITGGLGRPGASSVGGAVAFVGVALLTLAVQTVVQGLLHLGLNRMLFDAQDGKPMNVSTLFTQTAKLGRYVVAMLIVMGVSLAVAAVFGVAAVMVGSTLRGHGSLALAPLGLMVLVLIPLSVYVALPLQLLVPAVVDDVGNSGGLELLRRCYALADGHRLDLFAIGLIAGLVMLAGFLACCVGALPAFGMAQLLVVALYRALRNGSGV